MSEHEENQVWYYFCGIVFVSGVILFTAWYSKNVDRAVNQYADSCECRTIIVQGEKVEDCLCKTYPEKFKESMRGE